MTDLEIGLAIWLGVLWLIGAGLMACWLRGCGSPVDRGFWAAVAFWPPVMAGSFALAAVSDLITRIKTKRRRR